MLLLSRPLKNRWGFQASYVLSKAEGNVDNAGFGNWVGGNAWVSPNTALINNIGEMTNSRRHEFKMYVTYQIPKIEVMFSPEYTGLSGRPYTPYYSAQQQHAEHSGSSTRRQIYLLPRGSERNDFVHNFDLRAEKVFHVCGHTGSASSRTSRTCSTRGDHEPADPLSEHVDRRQYRALQGADRRAGRAPGHVRRPLVVLAARLNF